MGRKASRAEPGARRADRFSPVAGLLGSGVEQNLSIDGIAEAGAWTNFVQRLGFLLR